MHEFFQRSDSLRFAALSDGQQRQQEHKLERVGIRTHFEFVLTAEGARMAKPEEALFHLACERTGTRPAEIYYIGDKLEKNALGAIRAGLRGRWLNRSDSSIDPRVPTIHRLTDPRLA